MTAAEAAAPPAAGRGPLERRAMLCAARRLPLGVLACLGIAALTLLAPSAPTYDPWSWIVWGREILHLDLNTVDGPSWKPLPVAFTTVFALFGSAAPTLWVLVGRAGALYGVLAAFRLGRRLGSAPGGIAAAVALLLAPWYLRNGALGNSEGLQVAFALTAVDRHLAGGRRSTFLLALGLALLRPEAWPFVGLYAAWLAWMWLRTSSLPEAARALWPVAVGLVSLPILWLAPEGWGSGDWLRAAHRAQQPVGNSAAFAADPVAEVLHDGVEMVTLPVWIGLGLLGAFALWRREWRVGVLASIAVGWVLLVAVMTANGYSGNQRYLIVPVALAIVLAGAGAGRAAAALGRGSTATAAGAAAVLAVLFALPLAENVRPVLRAVEYQARLVDDLGPAVREAGGAERLLACGRPYSGAYLVPAVAWALHVHGNDVNLAPVRRPAVAFVARTAQGLNPVPPLRGAGARRTVAANARWRVVEACP